MARSTVAPGSPRFTSLKSGRAMSRSTRGHDSVLKFPAPHPAVSLAPTAAYTPAGGGVGSLSAVPRFDDPPVPESVQAVRETRPIIVAMSHLLIRQS